MPPEEDQAKATGNVRRKFSDVWTCGSGDTLADTQTQIRSSQYFAPGRSNYGRVIASRQRKA